MDNSSSDTSIETDAVRQEWQSVRFFCSGSEYFRIWIVNLVLTLATLGIYSAWATVRQRRYLYGGTEVAGSTFDFHGKPLQILFGRVIALILFLAWSQGHLIHWGVQLAAIAIIVLLFPWFMTRALSFRLRYTSLRNLRFDFLGSPAQAYRLLGKYMVIAAVAMAAFYWSTFLMFGSLDANSLEQEPDMAGTTTYLWVMLMVTISFVALFPAFICEVSRFSINNTAYGNHRFSANFKIADFSGAFWGAIGISFLLSLVAGVLVGLAGSALALAGRGDGEPNMGYILITFLVAYLVFGLLMLLPFAFWKVRTLNLKINRLELEGVRFRSNLELLPYAGILFTNAVAVLLTLGLAYPWAKVRQLRYQLENISFCGDVDQFSGSAVHGDTALGDEVGSSFDLGFDFGF